MKKYIVLRYVIVVFIPIILLAQGENWVYRYNGTANDYDCAYDLIYGDDSNIYVAGTSIDSVTGRDFTVINLTTAGDTNWVYRYNGPGNGEDWAYSVVYGADDNIYAAGLSTGIGTFGDLTVISLTTIGDTNWVYRYNGPGNFVDDAYCLVYGTDNNIYAAGYSYSDAISCDFTVISLTTAGNENWIYRYDGPGSNMDEAFSLVYGGDGNIYAVGYSDTDSTGDFTVISLNTTGDTNWIYRYNGPGNSEDWAYSVVYGANNNIYAAGFSSGTGTGYDFTVISLTSTGNENWVYRYDGLAHGRDVANSIVYGGDGNIYAVGYREFFPSKFHFIVYSLSATGDTNWTYWNNGAGNEYNACYSIAYGTDDIIYAAGCIQVHDTTYDIDVVGLTNTGISHNIYHYNGPGNDNDVATEIVYGVDSNIYIAGYSTGYNTGEDLTVISLAPDFSVHEINKTALKTSYSATILNGPLRLPKDKKCKVFDITGRIVMPDQLKPGVYFIEIDGKVAQKVIKLK